MYQPPELAGGEWEWASVSALIFAEKSIGPPAAHVTHLCISCFTFLVCLGS